MKQSFFYHCTEFFSYVLIYKSNAFISSNDIYILTFSGTLWLVCLVFLIVLGICLRITTIHYSKRHPEHEPWSWVEITLWAIAAACQQGKKVVFISVQWSKTSKNVFED